jgi:glycine/D-amino acid oxidase-like deaminating enzyme
MRDVIGARVAGSSTAMLLARKGLDVLVLDRASFPSDTLSTTRSRCPAWPGCTAGGCWTR